jgi:hypothetical protein
MAAHDKPDLSVCQDAERKVLSSNDFMTAHKKKNASHTWRATLAKRAVLELDLIRRIGDGTSTNIWNDKWIPNAIGFKLICRQDGATAIRVCDMLNQARSWDDRALAETLIPMDAAEVKCIPRGRIYYIIKT